MSRITSLAVLQTRMAVELRGCPEALRVQALMDAFGEFCRESEAWREELSAVDLVDGQVDYNLVVPFAAGVHRIEWLKINTEDGVTDGIVPADIDPSLYELTPGDPDVVTLDDTLEPAEDIADALTLKVVLMPEFNSLDIAEWFLNRYWRGIRAKAMALRMIEPDKRWTNAARAQLYEREYMDLLQDAKAEVTRNYKQENYTLPA